MRKSEENLGRREDSDKDKAKFWRHYYQPCSEEYENPQIRKSGKSRNPEKGETKKCGNP